MENKLYVFILRRAPHGEGGPKYGTEFDFSSACNMCGTCAKQIGPLFLKGSEIPKNKEILETLDHELLIAPALRVLFNEEKIKGVTFNEVFNYLDNKPLIYQQLNPQFTLPQLDAESRGIITENQCPKCKRDGFFDTVKENPKYVYASIKKSFLQNADIFATWEHFGNSSRVEDPPNPPGVFKPRKIIHYAKPRIIVNEKVKNIIEKLSIKGAEFEEVHIKNVY